MKYFAYGSNMNQEQMKSRCPDSKLIGLTFLSDYKIAFTIFSKIRNCGCADIIKSSGDKVWGLLYEISESDLANLDKAEGHPKHYKRFQVEVSNKNGEVCTAESYEVVTKKGDFLKPSKHYIGLMIDAASRFGFPNDYQGLLSQIPTID